MHKLSLFLLVITNVLFSLEVTGDEFIYAPVTIKESPMALEELIRFPSKYKDTEEDFGVVIKCKVIIERNGKMKHNVCFDEAEPHYAFVQAINRASMRAVFNPAKVNGVYTTVYYQYYVLFTIKDSKMSIQVVGNSGLQIDKYGFDYTSPQKIIYGRNLPRQICDEHIKLTINAVISREGKLVNHQVLGDNVDEKCIKGLNKYYESLRFIPAMFQGQAIAGYYSVNLFGNVKIVPAS